MDLGLAGKRAIVTGGTRGIGRRIVELLVAEGCHVGFCARDKEQVDATAAALSGSGPKVIGGTVDVTDDEALRRWVAETADALGGIDVLVCNASALAGADDGDVGGRGRLGSYETARGDSGNRHEKPFVNTHGLPPVEITEKQFFAYTTILSNQYGFASDI